jgi:hypothetical protein
VPVINYLSNYALRHEDLCGSEGIAAPFLAPVLRWRRMISFTPLPLYSWGKGHVTRWIEGWAAPRAGLDAVKETRNLPLLEI